MSLDLYRGMSTTGFLPLNARRSHHYLKTMQLKRLKTGGAIASAINAIIDHLPRLAIQSTPDINATQTPRGQFISLKRRQASSTAAVSFPHAFKVTIREVDGEKAVFVRWGTINGQPAFTDYPEKQLDATPTFQGTERVVLSVTGDFQTFESQGISQVMLDIEPTTEPLEAVETESAITWKIVLAYIVTTPGEQEGDSPTTTLDQVAKGHIFIGRGSPSFV
jgi:hypothetical protein